MTGDDPRVLAGRGKPAPDAFLLGAKLLGANVGEGEGEGVSEEEQLERARCLCFEDATNGAVAGLRAGMQGKLSRYDQFPVMTVR